jgi:hypothetical protein
MIDGKQTPVFEERIKKSTIKEYMKKFEGTDQYDNNWPDLGL